MYVHVVQLCLGLPFLPSYQAYLANPENRKCSDLHHLVAKMLKTNSKQIDVLLSINNLAQHDPKKTFILLVVQVQVRHMTYYKM